MTSKPRTSAIVGWILYDMANTIFSMGVISLFFSLWIRESVGADRADAVYGTATAISMGIIFLFSPLLGAMSDCTRKRMPFLITSTVLCVGCTALLGRFGFAPTIVLFVVANIAYQAGLQYYDSLLIEVSTPETRGRIGGIGVGVGYMGSFIAIFLGTLLGTADKPLLFFWIGALFLLFALPCFFFVREKGNPNPRPIHFGMVRNSTQQTLKTLRASREYPGLLRFLIGRVFYSDPIATVIMVMALFTVNVATSAGLPTAEGERLSTYVMLTGITLAIPGGFAWGWLVDRWGPKRTLQWVLRLWIVTFLLAAAVGLFSLPTPFMFLVGILSGLGLGGVGAADRPYMLLLSPRERIGEFYGLYGMVGRFSAVTGPAIWALVTYVFVHGFGWKPLRAQGLAIVILLSLVLVSYQILKPLPEGGALQSRDRAG